MFRTSNISPTKANEPSDVEKYLKKAACFNHFGGVILGALFAISLLAAGGALFALNVNTLAASVLLGVGGSILIAYCLYAVRTYLLMKNL